jgi:hypothetical protein
VPSEKRRGSNVGNIIETLKAYAKQETLGPLKGAGRWLGMGVLGSLCISIGILLLSMAVLRVLQEEAGDVFDGNWSFVPYLITLVVLAIFIAIAVSRMRKPTIQRKEVSG